MSSDLAVLITGMGFFTNAYDLYCISTMSKLLGRIYYCDPKIGRPGKLPPPVNNWVVGVALVGTQCGQLTFGWLGDKPGRKKVYGITFILMVVCAICSGLVDAVTNKVTPRLEKGASRSQPILNSQRSIKKVPESLET